MGRRCCSPAVRRGQAGGRVPPETPAQKPPILPRNQFKGIRTMKIARIEDMHADAGWRTFSFLKITTDDGLVGWSEYTEADGSKGLTAVIHGMAEPLIGTDPRPTQTIASTLWQRQIQAPNGVNQRAIAAI